MQKKVLAVIPARGGSKGIPKKNLKEINGVSLVGHAIQVAASADKINDILVSTDTEEIATEAEKFGHRPSFLRPKSISGDRVGDVEVLIHAIEEMEKLRAEAYQYVIMLQPTSPTRVLSDINAVLDLVIEKRLDSAWTVNQIDSKYHPLKQLVDNNGLLEYWDISRAPNIVARQQLTKTYVRNGLAYAFDRNFLMEERRLLGNRSMPVIVDRPSISIDTEEDMELAKKFLDDFNNEN